jgi:phage terminase small subunit
MKKLSFPSPPLAPVAPPKGLSAAAGARWRELQAEYGIEDSGGLSILLLHVQALMTAASAQKILDREGLTIVDRFGVARSHPACTVLRDARSQMLSTLRALNLDVIPNRERAGRPAGGRR